MPDAREASSPGASPLPTGFGGRPRSAPASSRLGPPGAKLGSSDSPLPGAKLGSSDHPLPGGAPSGMDPRPKAESVPHEGTAYSPGSEGSTDRADVKPDIITAEDEAQATAIDGPSVGLPTDSAEGVPDEALPAGSAPNAVADMGERANGAATDGEALEDGTTESGRAPETRDISELSAQVARLACAGGNSGDGDGVTGTGDSGTAADDGEPLYFLIRVLS